MSDELSARQREFLRLAQRSGNAAMFAAPGHKPAAFVLQFFGGRHLAALGTAEVADLRAKGYVDGSSLTDKAREVLPAPPIGTRE